MWNSCKKMTRSMVIRFPLDTYAIMQSSESVDCMSVSFSSWCSYHWGSRDHPLRVSKMANDDTLMESTCAARCPRSRGDGRVVDSPNP